MAYEKEKGKIPQILKDAFDSVVKDRFLSQDFKQYDKGSKDVVTECDIEVEKYIISEIENEFPGDSFISEELNSQGKMTQRTWIIDPIDGTINFSRGLRLFGLQIALVENGQPVFSCIYLPYLEELYIASKGQGAYLNGERIHTSTALELNDSIIAYGDFSPVKEAKETRNRQIQTFNRLFDKIQRFRMFGSSAIDFASLASSKTDAVIIFTKNLWDIFPGYFLAIEAGAVGNYDFDNPDEMVIAASNTLLMEELMEEVIIV